VRFSAQLASVAAAHLFEMFADASWRLPNISHLLNRRDRPCSHGILSRCCKRKKDQANLWCRFRPCRLCHEPHLLLDRRFLASQVRASLRFPAHHLRHARRQHEHLVALGRRALRDARPGRISSGSHLRSSGLFPGISAACKVLLRTLWYPTLQGSPLHFGTARLPPLPSFRLLLHLRHSHSAVGRDGS
jgi:hypothetical protein